MTDLEITRLCAEAMKLNNAGEDADHPAIGCIWVVNDGEPREYGYHYRPLHDDAQAMALVKQFRLHLSPDPASFEKRNNWVAIFDGGESYIRVSNADLNRAICLCVAKMQSAKEIA